jgi:peroxiredoxin
MREDLAPGNRFPDLRLPEHTGKELSLSKIAKQQPLVLVFARGWWCPKEQVRLRTLVSMQDEITREYGSIAAVTVDEPYVNGAFRAGLGASFPFLSDEKRSIAEELDLLELTDAKHRPYLPFTFVLDSTLHVRNVWCGFWYWGNPTPDELRIALREITRAEQPTFEPQRIWSESGAETIDAGIEADVIVIREDAEGREIYRDVFHGDIPEEGDEVGRSPVDGRPWLVKEIERTSGRVALHVRKGGEDETDPRHVKHRMTAPPASKVF